MALVAPKIDGWTEGYTDAYTCVREYIVTGAIDDWQKPVRGQPYTQQANWPTSKKYLVASWYLQGQVVSSAEDGAKLFILHVEGSTNLRSSGSGQGVTTTKLNTVLKATGEQELKITLRHVGARRATHEDAGYYWNADGQRALHASNTTDWKKPTLGGGFAEKGDIIYLNAKAAKYYEGDTEATQAASAGSASSEQAPFTYASGDNPLTILDLQDAVVLPTHTCTYWIATDNTWSINAPSQQSFHGWVASWGPTSGRKYGPIGIWVPHTNGRWRCAKQKIETDFDEDGGNLLKITRGFYHCPRSFGAIYWSRTKYDKWRWES